MAVLPDTQNYSERYPATFLAQTQWIAENQRARKIAWVLHLGDVTNRSTRDEWNNASRAIKTLEDAKIPYALCPGNHDYSAGGACQDRSTLLSEYFPVSRFSNRASFGGVYDREPERTENSFHRYGVAQATGDDVFDGEQLWDTLVSKHENFVLTLNGHVLGDGLGRLTSRTPGGRDVQQVLVNYQMRPQGGDGWLRLLEFKADGTTVEVCDYSPTREQRNEGPQNRFTLTLSPINKPRSPG